MNNTDNSLRIGQIYLMNFSGHKNEQSGWRPGLVFQNNIGNEYSPNIIALPLTTHIKKISQPTHVIVPAEGTGLLKDSMVLCENPERMSKDRIGNYLTTIPDEYMRLIAKANLLATAAISYIEPSELENIRLQAISLNIINAA